MRALGLDVGTRTIGVAVSDALGLAAHPLTTLVRSSNAADAEAVARLSAEQEAEALIVGMPFELSGAVGPRGRRVQAFIEVLRHAVTPMVVHEWDERFSTVAVERVLLQADLSRARRKQVVDKQAAAYILQGWLDAQRGAE